MTKILCPQCRGSGRADLTEIMQKTLMAVPRDREVTTKDIRDKLAITGQQSDRSTAINNRLAYLCFNGLIAMRQIGRANIWRRV